MKVLQIVPAITVEASGPSYSVARLCDQLIDQGTDVELCSLKWSAKERVPAYNKEFELIEPLRRLGVSPAMKRYVVRGTQRYDVIHAHGMWMMPGIYGATAALRRGVPLVWSPRGSLSQVALATGSRWKPAFWRLFQRRALERASLFHATSDAEAVDIRNMGFRAAIATIPNGIDVPNVRRELSPSGRTLLYLGRIHPIKGLPMLLEAWRELSVSFPEWTLSVVGPGEPEHVRQVRQMAAELDLKRVDFHEAAFGPAKWRHYATADLFVLPSHSENFGIAVAESLACGTPVVTTRGTPWAGVVDQCCGWWCDIGTASLHGALSEAMSKSREAREAMGERGRRWMARDYSWGTIAARMQECYRWMSGSLAKPAWIG